MRRFFTTFAACFARDTTLFAQILQSNLHLTARTTSKIHIAIGVCA